MRRRGVVVAIAAIAVAAAVVLAVFVRGSSSPCHGELSDPAHPPSHHDPELEDRFPDTVLGKPLEVQSYCANLANPGGLTMAPTFLEDLNIDLDDVTYAVTGGPSIGEEFTLSVTAFRYHGQGEGELRDATIREFEEAGESIRTERIDGREILTSDGPLATGMTLYIGGDTLYFVSGDGPACSELIAALP